MSFWEHRLLSLGVRKHQPIAYHQLHAKHSKIMEGLGLADAKAGTALHIFRSTGNAKLSRHGATKSQRDAWGRWDQSTQHVSYATKDSLHTLPMLALLAGWGTEYKKDFFLGRSTAMLNPTLFNEFAALLRPMLAAVEAELATKWKELHALPVAHRRWQCHEQTRTLLTDMQNSTEAEKRLIQVFLYGLPFLVDKYGDQLVVTRGSASVGRLLCDPRYQEYCGRVRAAHRSALQRLEQAKLPLEERMAASSEAMMKALFAQVQSVQAAPCSSLTQAPEGPLPIQQRTGSNDLAMPIASPVHTPDEPAHAARTGVLAFNNKLRSPLEAYEEWPGIEAQIHALSGLKRLGKGSVNNYHKRRHLVQRICLLMARHGLSVDCACGVYQRVMECGKFTLVELRDAVNHAEPVPDPAARGSRAADRSDAAPMPRDKKKPAVTKRQILDWLADAVQVALSS